MTFCGELKTDLVILGVLNTTLPLNSRNIGGAIAPPAPPFPPALSFEIGRIFVMRACDIKRVHPNLYGAHCKLVLRRSCCIFKMSL